jgi:hypothetical protein
MFLLFLYSFIYLQCFCQWSTLLLVLHVFMYLSTACVAYSWTAYYGIITYQPWWMWCIAILHILSENNENHAKKKRHSLSPVQIRTRDSFPCGHSHTYFGQHVHPQTLLHVANINQTSSYRLSGCKVKSVGPELEAVDRCHWMGSTCLAVTVPTEQLLAAATGGESGRPWACVV